MELEGNNTNNTPQKGPTRNKNSNQYRRKFKPHAMHKINKDQPIQTPIRENNLKNNNFVDISCEEEHREEEE